MQNLKVAIIGNPNCGKTTLFNALTGSKQLIANWPGVTVDKKIGYFESHGIKIELIDLPGIYSLSGGEGLDEKVAQDFLATKDYDLVINVVDSSNLARNLYLTLQLLEMKVPLIIALNMNDVAARKGINIDIDVLSKVLGVSAVKLTARKKKGVEELKEQIANFVETKPQARDIIKEIYPSEIYQRINSLNNEVALNDWEVIRSLESSEISNTAYGKKATTLKNQLKDIYDEDPAIIIAGLRHEFINSIIKPILQSSNHNNKELSHKLDKIFLNKYLGIPIFLIIIYLVFTFSIVVGGAFQDFFELSSEVIFMDIPKLLLEKVNAPQLLIFLIVDGIGGGIQTVLTFVPIIAGLYIFLSFLEDSGYLVRAAYLVDKAMKAIGLPGRAFFPLVIGFGCNVPAIMATRAMSRKEDRIAVSMMAPFMSCGARLSVYALFCAAFFPKNGQNIVFLLYIIGIAVGVFTGIFIKRSLLKGSKEYLMLELLDYHLPTMRGLAMKTYDKVKSFVLGAGKLIVIVFVILQIFNSVGFDLSLGNQLNGKSMLAITGKKITPIFKPMGINEENWPASVGIFTGIFAKEVVVGTLNSLYLSTQKLDTEKTMQKEVDLKRKLLLALFTIPENLKGLVQNIFHPVWLNISDQSIFDDYVEQDRVSAYIYKAMQEGFDGKIGAFAYLLFILLYFPCVSVFGIIAKEVGIRWAIFSALWSTGIGYIVAVIFYQSAKIVIG